MAGLFFTVGCIKPGVQPGGGLTVGAMTCGGAGVAAAEGAANEVDEGEDKPLYDGCRD